MPESMTVSPVPNENQDGSVSYHFDVEHHDNKMREIEHFNSNDLLFTDEFGEQHHRLEGLNFEDAIYEEEGYEPELTEYDFDGGITAEDGQYLRNITGGDENYADMIEWCADNLPEHIIDGYNNLFIEGNVDELAEVVTALYTNYLQNQDKVAPANYFEKIANSPKYRDLISTAQQVLSPNEIEKYNAIMNSGDEQYIIKAVQWLTNRLS